MTTHTTRAEALAAGSPTYFNGSPCKYGHVSPRYTLTSVCVECQRGRSKETRERDKARFRAAVENRQANAEG